MNNFTPTDAELVLKAFNGGLITEPDSNNPRGFTVRYRPKVAMLRALSELLPEQVSA